MQMTLISQDFMEFVFGGMELWMVLNGSICVFKPPGLKEIFPNELGEQKIG